VTDGRGIGVTVGDGFGDGTIPVGDGVSDAMAVDATAEADGSVLDGEGPPHARTSTVQVSHASRSRLVGASMTRRRYSSGVVARQVGLGFVTQSVGRLGGRRPARALLWGRRHAVKYQAPHGVWPCDDVMRNG
jgi:hypothetical protein